jgi:hypothetical protein
LKHGQYVALRKTCIAEGIDQDFQEASLFPDFGKIQFFDYPRKDWKERFPVASAEAYDFLDKVFQYESKDRIKAAEVCLVNTPHVYIC